MRLRNVRPPRVLNEAEGHQHDHDLGVPVLLTHGSTESGLTDHSLVGLDIEPFIPSLAEASVVLVERLRHLLMEADGTEQAPDQE